MKKADLFNDVLDSMRSLASNLQAFEDIAGDLKWLANNLQTLIEEIGCDALTYQNKNILPTVSSTIESKEPKSSPITLNQVRAVLAEKSRSGHTTEIRMLIEAHGVVKLSEIDPKEFSELLEKASFIGHTKSGISG